MSTAETNQERPASASPLTEADCARVRKERDRHVVGGGTWQAWNRVLEIVEQCRLVQDEYEEAARELASDPRGGKSLQSWLATGGTV